MIRGIRGVAIFAALAVAAATLAACAGSTVPSGARADTNAAATGHAPRSAILAAFRSWKRKDYADAISIASRAIRSGRLRKRGLSLAYFVRGLAYHSTRRHDAADADYTAAIANDPTNHLAFRSRGVVRSLQNDNRGAIEDLTAAIRIRPAYASYYVRGIVLLRLRRFDAADRDASAILDSHPEVYHGYYLRGLSRHMRGQYRQAARDYRRVLEINPDHAGARRALRSVGRGRPTPTVPRRRDPGVRLLPVSATVIH